MSKSIQFFVSFFIITLVGINLSAPTVHASEARAVGSPFLYSFGTSGVLEESYPMSNSSSPYFWLNSGGRLIIENGIGRTIFGPLSLGDKWQKLYAKGNPLDTAGGLYPENLFRLVTRSTWNNLSAELRFKISKLVLTDTPNRDGYSGVLLFSRYHDEDNLYYAGIREDGTAVIKKKQNGIYSTLAQTSVFPGVYDKLLDPNLIPTGTWMRLKMETKDQANGSIRVTLFLDKTDSDTWTQVLTALDNQGIKGASYAGIRTDYLDVSFDDYKLTSI